MRVWKRPSPSAPPLSKPRCKIGSVRKSACANSQDICCSLRMQNAGTWPANCTTTRDRRWWRWALLSSTWQDAAQGQDSKNRSAGDGSENNFPTICRRRSAGTLSYLLHPPLLDEAGLKSAHPLVRGGIFGAKPNQSRSLELPDDLGRLPNRGGTGCLSCGSGESLTNVHRHSGSSSATVRVDPIECGRRGLRSSDRGQGNPAGERLREMAAAKVGVGVRGMEEQSPPISRHAPDHSLNQEGTTVRAMIPLTSGETSNT